MNEEKYNALRDFYSKLLSPGDLVFDIGANEGNYTNIFVDIGCKVVSVEPQERCISQINERTKGKCTTLQCACGAKSGEKAILIRCNTDPCTTLSIEWIEHVCKIMPSWMIWIPTNEVKIISLDDMIKIFGIPKYIKIDVEGYEYEVIKGLSTSIDIISFEYSKAYLEPTYKVIERLKSLSEYEYNDFIEVGNTPPPYKFFLNERCDTNTIIKLMKDIDNNDKIEGRNELAGDLFAFRC